MMDDSGGMFLGGGFMWLFWLFVIVLIMVVAKAMMTGNAQHGDSHKDSPLSILEKRYARGEIEREEYQEKRRELED